MRSVPNILAQAIAGSPGCPMSRRAVFQREPGMSGTVNWRLSDNVRLEMPYWYGSLDRSGVVGKTQFFQTRLQLQL
jgi:hypothetical protein